MAMAETAKLEAKRWNIAVYVSQLRSFVVDGVVSTRRERVRAVTSIRSRRDPSETERE